MKKCLLFALTGVLSFSVVAEANVSGCYAEGHLGYGEVNETVKGFSTDNDGLMGGVNLGYRVNRNFAVEAGYALFPDVKTDYFTASKENYYFDLAAKGIMPIGNGFDLFAKLGCAMAHTKWGDMVGGERESKIVAFGGVGASYAIKPSIALVVQGTTTTKSRDDVPAMLAASMGLNFSLS